jgi:COMPASS component SDC1
MPPQPSAKPDKPVAHGGPTRQYLNQNVTPHLLEAMKHLAAHEPDKPLLWLSEFLRDRSKEVEG